MGYRGVEVRSEGGDGKKKGVMGSCESCSCPQEGVRGCAPTQSAISEVGVLVTDTGVMSLLQCLILISRVEGGETPATTI